MLQHRPDVDRVLSAQDGVVSTRQLRALGYSEGQVRRMTRRWVTVTRGIHVAGVPTWMTAVVAGLLAGGEDAVVGGAAAGYLHGIVGDPPSVIEIWARHAHAGFAVGAARVVFRQGERGGRGTPRRTAVEDTVLDIAATGSELDAVAACTRALAERLTTPSRLLEALGARRRQRHRRVVEELCDAGMRGIESVLEWLFETRVLRAHGLPGPDRQVRRAAGRVDAAYEGWGLIVELDGHSYHRDKGHDYNRDNEHVLERAERTLRFGWAQVVCQPCRSAEQVARALARGGWTGQPADCSCTRNA